MKLIDNAMWLGLLLGGCGSGSGIQDTGRDSDSDGESALFPPRECGTVFSVESEAVGVFLAGDFNGWSTTASPMEREGDRFELEVELEPGSYAYKFVEKDGDARWRCDPEGRFFHCEEGYSKDSWNDCEPGSESCNSLVVVEDCALPRLHVLRVDANEDSVEVDLGFEPGANGDMLAELAVTLDGQPQEVSWDGRGRLSLGYSELSSGRHRLLVQAVDAREQTTEAVSIPFWNDESTGSEGLLYFPMVDRFANAQAANDWSEGTQSESTDYRGGDWQGIENRLDDLHGLGVRSLWLTAPLDNPAGAWGDKCGTDFSAYHGYWPSSAVEFESHFGGEEGFVSLVTAAHLRGMRVMVDWVGNHVHEDHPYRTTHRDWFAEDAKLCQDANNWDDYPESCWFDGFLPDVDYSNPSALDHMIRDAVDFARKYDLDGYRVDAVKHMPMAVVSNLVSGLEDALEHPGANFEFYTLGETFDGDRGVVSAYVGSGMLDGQFDFPLYFSLRDAMFSGATTLVDLEAAHTESQAVYGTARMSTFLGNHDVERFVTQAAEGSHGECDSTGNFWNPAEPPVGSDAYQRLRVAWTWLLTRPGLPLVYYGDEIGLPGYFDPDNRQLMRFGEELSAEESATRAHVATLGAARLEHPALSAETGVLWWIEPTVSARLTQDGEDWALAFIHLGESSRTVTNGLAWAGMPEGEWRDVLTDERFSASSDALTVSLLPKSSRVLVWEGL